MQRQKFSFTDRIDIVIFFKFCLHVLHHCRSLSYSSHTLWLVLQIAIAPAFRLSITIFLSHTSPAEMTGFFMLFYRPLYNLCPARHHIYKIGFTNFHLLSYASISRRIKYKKSVYCVKSQFLCIPKHRRLSADNSISQSILPHKLKYRISSGKAIHHVNIYKNRFSSIFESFYNIGDISDIPIKRKDNLRLIFLIPVLHLHR